MTKKNVFLKLLVAGLFFGGLLAPGPTGAAEQEREVMPAGELILKGKKPARFDHRVHRDLGVDCGVCHHDGAGHPMDQQAIEALGAERRLRCVGCHNQDFVNPKLNSNKAAFHARCKGCHKQGVDGVKGPTKCKACHVKKKK